MFGMGTGVASSLESPPQRGNRRWEIGSRVPCDLSALFRESEVRPPTSVGEQGLKEKRFGFRRLP